MEDKRGGERRETERDRWKGEKQMEKEIEREKMRERTGGRGVLFVASVQVLDKNLREATL